MAVTKSEWVRGLVDFFFPPLCLGCGEYTETGFGICPECRRRIEHIQSPFCLNCLGIIDGGTCPECGSDSLPLFAFGNYTPPLSEIIIQYKFKGVTRPARFFAEQIQQRFGPDILACGGDLLVPVPLYASRENYRGYNQATVLAEFLAEFLTLPVDAEIISRVKKRKPQSRLGFKQRVGNIKGVFEVDPDLKDVSARGIILVDDVVTSGSTIKEAARTLREAGYQVAGAVAIAHAF
ncbi:MAG: ComF family protein [candidate division Zixibacteria bacterium]|nr:ComF family protein [candidate division Zixibacteria bacterium]